jgi:hypothetical protein
MSEVGGSRESLFARALNLDSGNAEDVRTPSFQVSDLFAIDVEARNLEACLGQKQGKRQPNVPESYDANPGGAILEAIETLLGNPRQNDLAGSRHGSPLLHPPPAASSFRPRASKKKLPDASSENSSVSLEHIRCN